MGSVDGRRWRVRVDVVGLVDRFGVSWQIIPQSLPGYVGGPDREGAKRATEAMMGMSKIVIADLKAAYEGTAE